MVGKGLNKSGKEFGKGQRLETKIISSLNRDGMISVSNYIPSLFRDGIQIRNFPSLIKDGLYSVSNYR